MRRSAMLAAAALLPLTISVCTSTNRTTSKSLNDRISNVELGVLPAVVVKGATPSTFAIEEMMERLSIPGVSVAVINEGRIEWAKSYGVTEAGGPPLDRDVLFQAGSVSKPVVAMVALTLVEEGRLDLDVDVNRYLSSWLVPENEFTREEKVTLRRLLSHTAGVSSFLDDDGAPAGEVPTLLEILSGKWSTRPTPVTVDLVPGSQMRYSNEGYAIVQQLLVDVEDKPFPEIMKERVLKPLGMSHSTFQQPLPEDMLRRAATGHIGSGEPVAGKGFIYNNMAAGGLWTTPSDLATFAMEIQRSLMGESNRVLTREMTELMLADPVSGYGLGLGTSGEGNGRSFGHSGHNRGFLCRLKALTEDLRGVVIMSNSNKAIPLLQGITFAVAEEYDWPGDIAPRKIEPFDLGPEELRAYTGRYVVGGDYFVTIGLEATGLTISHFEGQDVLIPASDTLFYQQLDGIELTFVKNERGEIDAISLMDGRLTLTRAE